MIILKFGGTSVGNADNIKKVSRIVNANDHPKIVVLSAVAGTTNSLVHINNLLTSGDKVGALKVLMELKESYVKLIDALFNLETYRMKAFSFLEDNFSFLQSLIKNDGGNQKVIIAQGEIISTNLFQIYQTEIDNNTKLLSALDFMSLDKFDEPDSETIKTRLKRVLEKEKGFNTYITQGFICMNSNNEIDNLKRGGSDYSASLIGAALGASEIQIWTDIDGMHNNDPRYVENTFSIDEISFDETAELAYFGAKILHPQSIIPAQKNNIPVLLKNTFNPNEKGTIIKNCTIGKGVRAIAAKDGIVAIKIKSYRMLMAYGFLKNVFEVFEKYQTAIDMITTSEIAVSLTIDNTTHLDKIINELNAFGKVEYDSNMSIICLAGDFSHSGKGISASVLNAVKEIPIRMISYGGSQYNMSLLVDTNDKVSALKLLNDGLFTQNRLQKV